jgi:uncharacterized protein (DUF433 family)
MIETKNPNGALVGPKVDQWLADRSSEALLALRDYVEATPQKLGGIPVFQGTRFSIPQLFTELADSDAVHDIADNFELDEEKLRKFLRAFAVYLNKPAP